MFREKPVNDAVYHIYNRGVEKRTIFLNTSDYLRFTHSLYLFNTREPTTNMAEHLRSASFEVGLRRNIEELVEIYAFCLMPNHFHLMVKQVATDGITRFMRKLGTGYTNYFNLKYERVGALFQGIYKAAPIVKEEHFLYLPYYIHANPLDLAAPEWREGLIPKPAAAFDFLMKYRWSSLRDYCGKANFPYLTSRRLIMEHFKNNPDYRREMEAWVADRSAETLGNLTID